ncbi:MAG: hypothetical protein M1820_004203 [Bogoriella megaspora]|nr:MAG: hypothetical protein M1820_004203 [Bogoriella megaspora]
MSMFNTLLLTFIALTGFAAAENSAFGFTFNTYLQFDNFTYTNHPAFLGYPQARNYVFEVNPQTDNPSTFCPARVQAAGNCPTPTPSNVKTQFNTTLVQNGAMGELYLNSAVPGGQQLYVQKNGLLRYTQPNAKPPPDSYTSLFQLEQHFTGSQLFISNPTLLWNSTGETIEGLYWYSCAQPNGGLNQTYANTPDADVTGCLPVALLSDAIWYGDAYAACPENPSEDSNGNIIAPECGYAVYEYN